MQGTVFRGAECETDKFADDRQLVAALQRDESSAHEEFVRRYGPRTWLHRILVNVCLMTLRTHSRRNEIPIDDLLPRFDHSGHHARSIARWRQLPEDRLQSDETRLLVRRCIDMLPDDYRSVIILRDIEELDTEEAAETLGISPGAVKTRLHRARQALRTLLEPHFVQ
jgi:RNA polymerase sigma-70 factor (ECF subfamily)